jgi:hypothetical protein
MFLPLDLFSGLTTGLLYLGPETVMPLVSFLAAALGIILIFWRYILRFVKRILGIKEKPSATAEEITPYVEPEDDDGPGSSGQVP